MVEADDDEDYKPFAYIKSLGPKFRGVEELITHPKEQDDGLGSRKYRASSSVGSDFNYRGEHQDYNYIRGLLEEMGADCDELVGLPNSHAYFHAEMPDGSKMVMAKLYDAFAKRQTGYPAFQGDKASNEIRQNVLDLA